MVILITGKTGVGKSELLRQLGAKNIAYMDQVVKEEFYVKSCPLYQEIISVFGSGVAQKDKISTSKLGQIVFANQILFTKLDQLVKPYVRKYITNLKGDWLVEMAAYLKLENDYSDLFDKVVLIQRDYPDLSKKFSYLKDKEPILKSDRIRFDIAINNSGSIEESVNELKKFLKGQNFIWVAK